MKMTKSSLERLIADGKEPSIKSFLSKMFDVYRSMAVYDWKYPGEYYVGPSRIALVSQEIIRVLLEFLPPEKHKDAGKTVGKAMCVPLATCLNVEPTVKEFWGAVFKHLRILGYGDLIQHGNLVIIRNPFLTDVDFFVGLMEGLTGHVLDVKSTQPLVLEVTSPHHP